MDNTQTSWYSQKRVHMKEKQRLYMEEGTHKGVYTRGRRVHTEEKLHTERVTRRPVQIVECTHGRVYTWRSVYLEECIHGGVYPWRNVHMEECTHRGVYT